MPEKTNQQHLFRLNLNKAIFEIDIKEYHF